MAERAGDAETGRIAGRILEQERTAAARIGSELGRAAAASLASQGVAL